MTDAAEPIAGLRVHLRKEVRGPIIASEGILPRDLADAMAELAFVAGLRRGRPPLDAASLRAQLRPVQRESRRAGRACVGFTLETEAPGGEPVRCWFDREALALVARRGSRRLVERGELSDGDLFYFELELSETRIGPIAIEGAAVQPTPDPAPIAPLLVRARLVDANRQQGHADEAYSRRQDDLADRARLAMAGEDAGAEETGAGTGSLGHPHYPVFYTREAFAKAERISRKGAEREPPIETGGLLLGRLHWCAGSRTLFAVVEDVLEALGAEGTTDSLTFTSRTWQRAQAVVRARQRRPAFRSQKILGVCHGHNFLPYDVEPTCDGCPSQSRCKLTSAYLSDSDRRWSRAVFPREPWQISLVFGLTPRREPVAAFYGQRGGVLERRGYHLIDS